MTDLLRSSVAKFMGLDRQALDAALRSYTTRRGTERPSDDLGPEAPATSAEVLDRAAI